MNFDDRLNNALQGTTVCPVCNSENQVCACCDGSGRIDSKLLDDVQNYVTGLPFQKRKKYHAILTAANHDPDWQVSHGFKGSDAYEAWRRTH